MNNFVQDLWGNPFIWPSFAVVVVIRLLCESDIVDQADRPD